MVHSRIRACRCTRRCLAGQARALVSPLTACWRWSKLVDQPGTSIRPSLRRVHRFRFRWFVIRRRYLRARLDTGVRQIGKGAISPRVRGPSCLKWPRRMLTAQNTGVHPAQWSLLLLQMLVLFPTAPRLALRWRHAYAARSCGCWRHLGRLFRCEMAAREEKRERRFPVDAGHRGCARGARYGCDVLRCRLPFGDTRDSWEFSPGTITSTSHPSISCSASTRTARRCSPPRGSASR